MNVYKVAVKETATKLKSILKKEPPNYFSQSLVFSK